MSVSESPYKTATNLEEGDHVALGERSTEYVVVDVDEERLKDVIVLERPNSNNSTHTELLAHAAGYLEVRQVRGDVITDPEPIANVERIDAGDEDPSSKLDASSMFVSGREIDRKGTQVNLDTVASGGESQ